MGSSGGHSLADSVAPVSDEVLAWLQAGDVAVRYQVQRDLFGYDDPALQARIATEGNGAVLLAARRPDGYWGQGFYQPNWTCTHYTLLELTEMGLAGDHPECRETVQALLTDAIGSDGGLNPSGTLKQSDVCINGMALQYCAWFGATDAQLATIVDFVLGQQMADGGFNCRSNRSGARTSSVHTTASVILGFAAYLAGGSAYRANEVRTAMGEAAEFLLSLRLCRSRRRGEVLKEEFLRLHHPARWYYDVLRGLEALAAAGVAHDARMDEALALVRRRQRSDGRWAVARAYPGETHVPGERAGQPSRWVTLRALRVLGTYHSAAG